MALVLAGCLSGEDDPGAGSDDDPSDGDGQDDSAGDGSDDGADDGPGDGSGGDPEHTATIESFTADPLDGTAPLNVTFDWDVETNDENATWALDFGDGDSESGDVADADDPLVHGYDAGNFTATFTVTYGGSETVEKTVNLTLEEGQSVPDELVFEYEQPTLGCLGAVEGEMLCISVLLGPEQPAIDGHWQELDESYWGLPFAVVNGLEEYQDTDCTAFDEEEEPLEADLNNVDGPCGGTLPEGTKWLFLYSFVAPSPSMTLEFSA